MNATTPVIRATRPLDNVDMVPQAIFGRPIQYFTLGYHEGHDDLDVFSFAAFAMNNECHFCLRYYQGHPKQTVTAYFEYDIVDVTRLRTLIRCIVEGFRMPTSAVRWERGDEIKYGMVRPLKGRLREPEARILALKIALTCPSGRASTSYIKDNVPRFVPLTAEDLKPSPTRKNEKKWQQVVGNVISHQQESTSIFSLGYARRTDDGIIVTKAGRDYLSDMGFLPEQGLEDNLELKLRSPR